jgi:hypothetical protein
VTERHVHFGWGHGPGVLEFLWDVDLLGKRVAYYLSSENEEGWSAIDDLIHERDVVKPELNELAITGQISDDVKWLM